MLEQIVITPEKLKQYRRITERKLNAPPLNFSERIRDRHTRRAGVLSLEGTLSTEAIETFFASYGATKEALQSMPLSEKATDVYALFVAAA